MGFPLAVIPLISSSHVCKAKEAFLYAYSTTNNLLITYKTNLLEYNSSQDKHLKFQNGGHGAWQLRQGFLMITPITDTPFEVKHLK